MIVAFTFAKNESAMAKEAAKVRPLVRSSFFERFSLACDSVVPFAASPSAAMSVARAQRAHFSTARRAVRISFLSLASRRRFSPHQLLNYCIVS